MNIQEKQAKTHRNQQHCDYQREVVWALVKGERGHMYGERRGFDSGWWAHNAIYRGFILYNLISHYHPNIFN